MSYEPTVWKAGDTVTSAKLNKMEQGIASSSSNSGGVLIVEKVMNNNITTLNKTWQEIYDAFPAVFIYESEGNLDKTNIPIARVYFDEVYTVLDGALFNPKKFTCIVPNDYPVQTDVAEGGLVAK